MKKKIAYRKQVCYLNQINQKIIQNPKVNLEKKRGVSESDLYNNEKT